MHWINLPWMSSIQVFGWKKTCLWMSEWHSHEKRCWLQTPSFITVGVTLSASPYFPSQSNQKAARWNRGFLHTQSFEGKAAYVRIFFPLIMGWRDTRQVTSSPPGQTCQSSREYSAFKVRRYCWLSIILFWRWEKSRATEQKGKRIHNATGGVVMDLNENGSGWLRC